MLAIVLVYFALLLSARARFLREYYSPSDLAKYLSINDLPSNVRSLPHFLSILFSNLLSVEAPRRGLCG